MKATSGRLPVDDAGEWAYEVKWDGMRAVGRVAGGQLRLTSANDNDVTDRFPELQPLAGELAGHTVVLDGEIVSFNSQGRPDFGRLQHRMHVASARVAAEKAAVEPVVWVVFDLLWLDGHDTTGLPYDQRRHLLEALVEPGPNWQVPRPRYGDGRDLLDAVTAQGLEGLVAKRRASPYHPGTRTTAWRKVKMRRRQEMVVGGYTPGEGGRHRTFGALLVGYHDHGHLRYGGRVGSGFDQAELQRMTEELVRRETPTCPFEPVPPVAATGRRTRWVRPDLVVEVAFTEWSADGVLRHPSYLGERTDKDPAHVGREP